MPLVYFSPCIWRWIFWYREWSEIENFITISSIKISIIWEYACWHNTSARWRISSFCLNGYWKFWKHESIACQNIEKQFCSCVPHVPVEPSWLCWFWMNFSVSLLSWYFEHQYPFPPSYLGGGGEVHFRLLSIRESKLFFGTTYISCVDITNPLTPMIWLLILPCSWYTFPSKYVMRIWW